MNWQVNDLSAFYTLLVAEKRKSVPQNVWAILGAKRGNVDFKRSPMLNKKNSEKSFAELTGLPGLLADVVGQWNF